MDSEDIFMCGERIRTLPPSFEMLAASVGMLVALAARSFGVR
jgi:hypothetical protein